MFFSYCFVVVTWQDALLFGDPLKVQGPFLSCLVSSPSLFLTCPFLVLVS